jgi:hypothetical protein
MLILPIELNFKDLPPPPPHVYNTLLTSCRHFFNSFSFYCFNPLKPALTLILPISSFGIFKKLFFLMLFIASSLVCPTEAQAVDIGFELSGGISTSGDYVDSITEAYEEKYGDRFSSKSGLGMFFEIGAALPIGLVEKIVIKPKISLLITAISVEEEDSYGSSNKIEIYFNTIFIPALTSEYYINGYKESSFFFGGEIGAPFPSGGNDEYELGKKGISFGVYVGYAFYAGVKISIGYRSIPVEITYFPGAAEYKKSKDFGGVSFLFAYTF